MNDGLIVGITTLAALASSAMGEIVICTVPKVVATTVPATGVAGWLGFTKTASTIMRAPVTLPVAAIVATGALLTYGGYQAYKLIKTEQ